MNQDTLLALINKRFGHIHRHGEQVYVNCPFCVNFGLTPNTTYKLGIHLEKKVFNCFRCPIKGRLVNLLPQLATIAVESVKVADKIEEEEKLLEQLPGMQYLEGLDYPWNFLVYEFLNNKEFPAATITNKVFFCEDYQKNGYSFGPRLIFPIYQFGTYRGFQGRSIYKNTYPKYIGASNMNKRTILYNYDIAFSQNEQLVITEGFFDQIRVGDTAVATLGKIITEEQIRLIKLGEFKKVIVFLDKDAEKEAYENADKLKSTFPTYFAKPKEPFKDPGEMTRHDIQEVFNNRLARIY